MNTFIFTFGIKWHRKNTEKYRIESLPCIPEKRTYITRSLYLSIKIMQMEISTITLVNVKEKMNKKKRNGKIGSKIFMQCYCCFVILRLWCDTVRWCCLRFTVAHFIFFRIKRIDKYTITKNNSRLVLRFFFRHIHDGIYLLFAVIVFALHLPQKVETDSFLCLISLFMYRIQNCGNEVKLKMKNIFERRKNIKLKRMCSL